MPTPLRGTSPFSYHLPFVYQQDGRRAGPNSCSPPQQSTWAGQANLVLATTMIPLSLTNVRDLVRILTYYIFTRPHLFYLSKPPISLILLHQASNLTYSTSLGLHGVGLAGGRLAVAQHAAADAVEHLIVMLIGYCCCCCCCCCYYY